MVIIASGLEEIEHVPETLEEFFQAFPSIGQANQALTAIPHVNMWRDQVLFIKQRQQATSDYRENPNVRWLGSHAAMTCHIVIMRHRITGVVSLGHFDNFCCWQFGEESSAHRDGLDGMIEEITYLSNGNFDNIEVTVVGGYTDARGDAAKNSLSLLQSLHDHWCYLNLIHFCVGKYNTQVEDGINGAILKGIAIDLSQQEMFPAIFAWGQYEDFKNQLKEKILGRIKEDCTVDDTHRITAHSTFKPKSLKNQARSIELVKQATATVEAEKKTEFDSKLNFPIELLKKTDYSKSKEEEEKESASALASFRLKLRPTTLPTNARNSALELWGASLSNYSKKSEKTPKRKKRRKM